MQHLNNSLKSENVDSKRNLFIEVPQEDEEKPARKQKQVFLKSPKEDLGLDVETDNAALIKMHKLKTKTSRRVDKNSHIEVEDMLRLDRNGRTVLHRAALDQNVPLVMELCDRVEVNPLMSIEAFVNLRDKFGNTALANACVYNGDYDQEKRAECLKVLLDRQAKPDIANQRTLWTPLHWCAYYGDDLGIKLLLEKGATAYWPDNKGYYALDHCGLQDKAQGGGDDRRLTAQLLVENLTKLIIDFDQDKKNPDIAESYKSMDVYRFLKTPFLRASTLYWAIYFKLSVEKFITPLLAASSVFIEMPIFSINMRNCYHACCVSGNLPALSMLFDDDFIEQRYRKILMIKTGAIVGDNEAEKGLKKIVFFEVKKEEKKKKVYDEEFLDYIQDMPKWILNYQQNVVNHTLINLNNPEPLPFYELRDEFGNTPLHLASFMGHIKIVNFMLAKNVNVEIENKDGWRCRELQQHDKVKQAYREHMQKRYTLKKKTTKPKAKNKISVHHLGAVAMKKNAQRVQPTPQPSAQPSPANAASPNSVAIPLKVADSNNTAAPSNSVVPLYLNKNIPPPSTFFRRKVESAFNKALFMYREERVIPDVVILFQTGDLKEDHKRTSPVSNRANFNISLIQTRIDSYLARGLIKGSFYLMLRMEEKKLEDVCHQNSIRVKLINDYNYLPFDPEKRTDFEPFRSRQRQEITLTALNNIVDLNQLKELKVVSSVYPMHTISGMDKIYNTWIKSKKWYLPEPLISFKEYYREGRNLNFAAITTLKVYFGEKFSFYFAWMSFYMCALTILAVPGTAVFLLDLLKPETQEALLPAWVLYNALVSTLLVERWKRKGAEIATRWGTIDLLNKAGDEGMIRKEYSGDEVISDATGTLTKENKENTQLLYYLCSFVALIVFSAIVIYSFLLTEDLKKNNPFWVIKTLIGAINGIVVSLANFIYEFGARYFADKENHKYEESYERSLVFKMFTFKAVNSYLGVLYLTFVANKDYDDLFWTLLSLLLSTQATNLGLATLLPYIRYQYRVKMYIKRAKKYAKRQLSLLKDKAKAELPEDEELIEDKKEKKKRKKKEEEDLAYKRPVLNCRAGKPAEEKWDLMQVELNALRPAKRDILDYYGTAIVQFGYITMFSPAFSLGPAIAIVANVIDTKVKLWTFLNVYQRPVAEKSGGIGSWLITWEVISVFGIFVNALSLFFNLDTTLGYEVFETPAEVELHSKYEFYENINRLWMFAIIVHAILIVKWLVIVLIEDKPKWVLNQEEKQAFEDARALDLRKDQEHLLRIKTLGKEDAELAKELFSKNKKLQKAAALNAPKHQRNPSGDTSFVRGSLPEIRDKERENSVQRRTTRHFTMVSPTNKTDSHEKETKQDEENQPLVVHSRPSIRPMPLTMAPLNLKQAIKSVMLNTFILVERELTMRRMRDVNKLREENIFECYFCVKAKSTHFCASCEEYFCQACRTAIHDKINNETHDVMPIEEAKANKAWDFEKLGLKTGTLEKKNKNNQLVNYWRKFESFNFPVKRTGDFFYQLKAAYQILYKLYITGNGINKQNELNDVEKALKFKRAENSLSVDEDDSLQKLLPGEMDFSYERELDRFLSTGVYNVEERYFMNRIAFLNFKRRGADATFDEFFKKITTLQEGSIESKLFLLFDLLDQDDDGTIDRKEMEDLFKVEFMQNLKKADRLDSLLSALFQNAVRINKKTLFQIALKEDRVRNLFSTLTQAS